MKYEYKRDFYFDILDSIKTDNVIFLLGPRKTGKTVGLIQIKDFLSGIYVDFKGVNSTESMNIFNQIVSDIKEDKKVVYLLDEITYAHFPEREIEKIAVAYNEVDNQNTKVVFSGSQSVALEVWGHKSFCGNAKFFRVDFLTYHEWLKYKGIDKATAENYNKFLYEVNVFYNFNSLEDYLIGCLNETDNVLFGNDVYLLENDTDVLLDILYTALFTLHNQVASNTFDKKNRFQEDVGYYFRDICDTLNLDERISTSFIGHYTSVQTRDLETIKQALIFLYQAGLITITPVVPDLNEIPNLYKDLRLQNSKLNYKEELFKTYNICIKYPMFYIAILKDIFKEDMPSELSRALLGSIIECHARGLLPNKNCVEIHDENDREIDYVNLVELFAIELSIRNKRDSEVNFQLVSDLYKKILLTRDKCSYQNGIYKIPYYKFFRAKSIPKLLENIKN